MGVVEAKRRLGFICQNTKAHAAITTAGVNHPGRTGPTAGVEAVAFGGRRTPARFGAPRLGGLLLAFAITPEGGRGERRRWLASEEEAAGRGA